jgi:chlorite dismutase
MSDRPSVTIEVRERGAPRNGEPQWMDRRLFMQLLVFRVAPSASVESTRDDLIDSLEASTISGVIYEDAGDPRGLGLLTWSEDPADFVTAVRPMLNQMRFEHLELDPDFTMTGRTYSVGYERDLVDWIIERPKRNALDPKWQWAVWYPLRRKGTWGRLDAKEQRRILGEHAGIGRAYGASGHATDIRLACHGLDRDDNDYIIGILAADLHRASHLVERMRKTEQTAE